MPSAADRVDFGPPRDAGSVRAFGLALLAHGLLIAALTWGVNWKRSDDTVAFEAEIWSAVRQEAAPKLVEPLPAPLPPTTAAATPAPLEPQVKTPPPAPAPDADIALEQDKKRKLLQKKKQQQQERQERQEQQEQKEAELLAKKQKDSARDLKAKKDQAKKDQDKKEQDNEQQAKRKALDDAKKLEAKKQALKEQASASSLVEQRKQNLARAMGQAGLAGATGADSAKGSGVKASGPSASYGGKVKGKVKPNIVFTEDIQGNQSAEVEVRTGPDGTIMSQRLVKSSGNKAWDDAVIKAIIRTETMPRDVDGRVPSPMIIEFRPKD